MRQHFSWRSLASAKVTFFVALALLAALVSSFGRELSRRSEVHDEVARLGREIAALERDNGSLAELIGYMESDTFREREARLKLGLAKPGERTVYIPDVSASASGEVRGALADTTETQQSTVSIPAKWWQYLFPHSS